MPEQLREDPIGFPPGNSASALIELHEEETRKKRETTKEATKLSAYLRDAR